MATNLNLKLNADTLPLKGTSADGKTSDVPDMPNVPDNQKVSLPDGKVGWNPGSSWYTVNGISSNDSDTGTLSWNNGNGHGAYYQFNAATAGQGNSVTNNGGNTNQSVCPSGWRLPTSGNGTGEFRALMSALGASFDSSGWVSNVSTVLPKLMGAPVNFTYSGYVFSGSLNNVGSYGRYWSSTSSDSASAYYLDFLSSSIIPSYYNYRRLGFPVRCVAR